MPVFTLTAPTITPQDEEIERRTLTPAEQDQLKQDLAGSRRVGVATLPETIHNALALMNDAIEDFGGDRSAYLQACQKCPNLVESESPKLAFLRCEGFDAWAAAARFLKYWTTRVVIFGQEKAFLPLTLNGAMEDDIDTLQLFFMKVVPDDKAGRPCWYYDRTRFTAASVNRDSVVLALSSEVGQELGSVLVANLKNYDIYKHYDRIFTRRGVAIADSIPIKVAALHFCLGNDVTVIRFMLPMIKFMLGKRLRLRLLEHRGTNADMARQLADYGLDEMYLLKIMNGPCVLPEDGQWLQRRRDLEGKLRLERNVRVDK